MTTWVLDLDDPCATDITLVGGKAAGLAAARRLGHRVPEGFVISTDATRGGRLHPEAVSVLRAAATALGGRVAVRSSAVAEAGSGASFAGMFRSVLDVAGPDAVLDAVAECLRSPLGAAALAYARRAGVSETPMAVLVQRFVQAHAAGVAQTRDPLTGRAGVVRVHAVRGVGEALMAGREEGEIWEVADVARRVGESRGVLDGAQALAVARATAAVSLEPTEVEWALTLSADGAPDVHVLQVRPMTALPAEVSWDVPYPGVWFRALRLGEWIGAPVSPLFHTWWLPLLEQPALDWMTEATGLRAPEPVHALVNGWYYYGGANVDVRAATVLRGLPKIARTLLRRPSSLLVGIPPLAHLGFDRETRHWRESLVPELLARVAAAEREVPTARPEALCALVEGLVSHTGVHFASVLGVAGYAAKAEMALLTFWRKHLSKLDASPYTLVRGAPSEVGPHAVEGLDPVFPTLGERGRTVPPPPPARLAALDAEGEAVLESARAALPPRLRGRLEACVHEARRAHRVRQEQTGLITLAWPVLRRALLRLGDVLVEAGVVPRSDDVHFVELAELRAALAGAREPLPVLERRALWERRRHLAPPLVLGTFPAFVKAQWDAFMGLFEHADRDAPQAVVGLPASAGCATGPARVVLRAEELDRVQPGEVLVAPVTTPLWTLAFDRAAAVVTDGGSAASHAAVVAREYGLPCVVSTGDATRRLSDGEWVAVDGGRGVVRRLMARTTPTRQRRRGRTRARGARRTRRRGTPPCTSAGPRTPRRTGPPR